MTNNEERIYYMDNVRALAMLLGILFHASIPYGTLLHEVWIITDIRGNWLMDFGAWFSHLFRMPMFFIVAGFFAHLLINKRGTAGFLKNRAARILIPFVVFWPIVGISTNILIVHAVETVTTKLPLLQFIAVEMNNPDAESPPASTTHLWFLYQLIWFYILTVIGIKFKMESVSRYLDRIFSNARHLIYLPLLLVPSLFVTSAPLPAPERVYPELWSFGYFGLFFLFGWVLFSQRGYLDLITPYWKHMLGAGVVLYTGFFLTLPDITLETALKMENTYDFSLKHLGVAVIEAYATLFLTLAFLILGKKYLDIRHGGLRYIADSSYWVYIIHFPVLMLIQIHLVDVEISIWLKFLVSSLLTLSLGLVSYVILVRYTPVGWLLNGRKKRHTDDSPQRLTIKKEVAETNPAS